MRQTPKFKKIITHSALETIAFAKKLAGSLVPGSVLALEGDLGSGKTTFVKGIALGLGLTDKGDVKSPTFVLMHIYKTRIPLYHFDLYRLDSSRELQAIGFEEFAFDQSAITCIEWADKAPELIPDHALHIHFAGRRENSREISMPCRAKKNPIRKKK